MWIPLITFLLTTLACFAITAWFVCGRRNREHEVLTGRGRRPLIFGALTEALAGVLPTRSRTRQQFSRFLRQAGHYHRRALAEFLALRNALVVGWALVVATAMVVATEPGDALMCQMGAAGLVVLIVLYSLPRLVLETMAKNRVQRIEEGLPDGLDMISMCMSGGLPLQFALTRVSDEIQGIHSDLAFELRIVGRQMEAGSLDHAVRQFAERIDAPEVHSLATMIWQTEQQGSGVAAAFEAFSDNVRLNRRQRAEEAGNKTAVKMLFPLVFCLAPPVYLMLLAPAAMELREFLRRENLPGGALSASAENMRPLLTASPSGSAVPLPPAATTTTGAAVFVPAPPAGAATSRFTELNDGRL